MLQSQLKKVVRYHAIMHWNTHHLLPYEYRGSIVLSAPHACGGRAIKIFLKGDTEFLFCIHLRRGGKNPDDREQGMNMEHGKHSDAISFLCLVSTALESSQVCMSCVSSAIIG